MLSCLGKLFTSIISKRLYTYAENFEVLGKEQAGFRKNHSTTDHIFVLYTLINLYTKKNKRKVYFVHLLILAKLSTLYLEYIYGLNC